MAIIFTEDLTRNQGKLANADIIQGSWRTVGSKSDLNALTGSVSDQQRIEDGQLFWAKDEDKFYRYKVVQAGFSTTLTFEEFSFGGGSTPDGTISGSQQISDLGFLSSNDTGSFILASDTSSMSVATASYVSPTFISASAAASGFGAGGGDSTDISALNTFTGSIQTEVDSLTSATSSYLTSVPSGTISGSTQVEAIIDDTYISASAALSGFGAGGDSIPDGTISSSQQITDLGFVSSSADVSALNTFTGSIQTEVDSLTSATSSYLTSEDTSSFISSDVTSSMTVATASYALYAVSASYEIVTELSSSHAVQADSASFISDTFISASAVRSGFGAGDSTDISSLNTFTGSIQTEVDSLTNATSSYLTEVPNGTLSGSQQITDLGFISSSADVSALNIFTGSIQTEVDSLTNATSSYLTAQDTGSFLTEVPNGTLSGSQQISDLGFISSSADVSALNTFTGSIQTEVDSLTNATSSYLTAQDTGSFLTEVPGGTISGSQQISDLGFISSSTDISALNTFTGSIQTDVDSLTSATSSYLTVQDTGSFITSNVTSSMTVATASYALYAVSASYEIVTELSSSHAVQADSASFISDTFISASAVRSGFGSTTDLPSGTVSSSQQISDLGFITSSSDISALNTFTGSIQTEVDSLTSATSSYLTSADVSDKLDVSTFNSYTSSNDTKVDSLTSATSSYLTAQDTGSFVVNSQTGSFLTELPDGVISGSSQITITESQISDLAHTDVSGLNTFTGSIQTEVDNLTSATSSYLTSADVSNKLDVSTFNSYTSSNDTKVDSLIDATSSFISSDVTSSMTVATASFINSTFISASAAASGFGSAGQAVEFTGSLQDVTDQGASTTNVISTPEIILTGSLKIGRGNDSAVGSIAVGNNTLKNNTTNGVSNTAIGDDALEFNTNGQYNTAVGNQASEGNTTGRFNVAVGAGSLVSNQNGRYNIAIGSNAGGYVHTSNLGNSAPTSSIFIGANTKARIGSNENQIVIGHEASGSGDNTVTIGNSSITNNYFSGEISGSDVAIDDWGSISASLATLSSNSITSEEVVGALVGEDLVVNSITAETYIISSSITHMTTSFSSGSTMFGDSADDTHQFTGSLLVFGDVEATSFTGSLFGTSSWAINAINADTASFISDTFISASAARSGFGAGGSGTLDEITSNGATTSNDLFLKGTIQMGLIETTGSGGFNQDSLVINSNYQHANTSILLIGSGSQSTAPRAELQVVTTDESLRLNHQVQGTSYTILKSNDDGAVILNSWNTGSLFLKAGTKEIEVSSTSINIVGDIIQSTGNFSGNGAAFDDISIDGFVSVSASLAELGNSQPDITPLNTFSGSIQTEVDTLTQSTASYVDNTNTVFVSQSVEPTPTDGGLYYDGTDFYLGV